MTANDFDGNFRTHYRGSTEPKERSSIGYIVQARIVEHPHHLGEGLTLDEQWREVEVEYTRRLGIPAHRPWEHRMSDSYLLSYPAAMALQWWIHAIAYAACVQHRVQTRLVGFEVRSTERLSVGVPQEPLAGLDLDGPWQSVKNHKAPNGDAAP